MNQKYSDTMSIVFIQIKETYYIASVSFGEKKYLEYILILSPRLILFNDKTIPHR